MSTTLGRPFVEVFDEATEPYVPDTALFNISIVVENKDEAKAKEKHDSKVAKVVKVLDSLNILPKNRKTTGRSSRELTDLDNKTNQRTFRAHQISQNFNVKIDFDKAGKLVDSLTDIEKNITHQQYGSELNPRDLKKVHRKALLQAIENAKENALAQVAALGATLGKPIIMTQNVNGEHEVVAQRSMRNLRQYSEESAGSALGSHFEAGESQVTEKIKIVFEIL